MNIIKRVIKSIVIKILPHYIKRNEALKKVYYHKKIELVGLSMNVPNLLKESTLLISPFSVEHFSRPVIEAFAYKKPAIGTNVEGMDEIIDHNENGLIVEKDNPKALAEAINYLCSNPDIVQKMGENGYHKALRLFSPKNVHKVEKIYDEIY